MFLVAVGDRLLTVAVRRARAYRVPGLAGYQVLTGYWVLGDHRTHECVERVITRRSECLQTSRLVESRWRDESCETSWARRPGDSIFIFFSRVYFVSQTEHVHVFGGRGERGRSAARPGLAWPGQARLGEAIPGQARPAWPCRLP